MPTIRPPQLNDQDLVTIVAPARFVEREFIDLATEQLQKQGLRVQQSKHLFARKNQFAGTDVERAADINAAIHDPSCRAILCARGGYGNARLLDLIDWDAWARDPKWVVGYSDITALHASVYNRLGMQSIHATMPVNFADNSPEALDSLFDTLRGESRAVKFDPDPLNRSGEAVGQLIGGNLSVLYSLLGSDAEMNTAGKLLVLEDLDEYLYHVDRMMLALDRAGMLKDLAGLIVGGLTAMNDNPVPFGATASEIVARNVEKYDFPLAFGFPTGHIKDNRAWIHGKKRRLTVLHDQPSTVDHC